MKFHPPILRFEFSLGPLSRRVLAGLFFALVSGLGFVRMGQPGLTPESLLCEPRTVTTELSVPGSGPRPVGTLLPAQVQRHPDDCSRAPDRQDLPFAGGISRVRSASAVPVQVFASSVFLDRSVVRCQRSSDEPPG